MWGELNRENQPSAIANQPPKLNIIIYQSNLLSAMSAPEPAHTPTPPPPVHKPWPLKWIAFAILIYAFLQVLYLFLTTR